jgi:hypothetical protein
MVVSYIYWKPEFMNLSDTADPLPKIISYVLIKQNTDQLKYR